MAKICFEGASFRMSFNFLRCQMSAHFKSETRKILFLRKKTVKNNWK